MNRTTRIRLAMLACAWILAPAPLQAAPPASDWVGSEDVSAAPSSLRLRVVEGDGATFRFGAGRNCALTLRTSTGSQVGMRNYRITGSSGGRFCDRLFPGTLWIAPVDGEQLSVSLLAGGQRYDWLLRRADATVDPALHGTWSGWLPQPQLVPPVDVRLTIGGTEPGDADSTLQQGGDRQCQIGLAYQGKAGSAHYFLALIRQVAGGYCEVLVDRLLRVEVDGAELRFRFIPDDGQCGSGCVLGREEDRAAQLQRQAKTLQHMDARRVVQAPTFDTGTGVRCHGQWHRDEAAAGQGN